MDKAEAQAAYKAAIGRLHRASKAIEALPPNCTRAQLSAADQELKAASAAADAAAATVDSLERAPIRVGAEARTYRPDGEHSFFTDAFRAHVLGDITARERLDRHGREAINVGEVQQRDVGTGAFAGLTVPQYLVDLYAPLARAGRPFANAIRQLPLPAKGMTVNISRITTGTAVAAQATENSGVQETDADDTLLTVNVVTVAGQQDVSRQALERSELVDVVVYGDLAQAYAAKLDDGILNADGTSGTHLGVRSTSGIISVTYTDASPTVPEIYSKLADAIQQVNTNRFLPPTLIAMHPRRWGWFTASLDANNRPLVLPYTNGPFNAVGVGVAPEYGQIVGAMHGLPVLTDANIPTNLGGGTEDVILIVRADDMILWEESADGMPRQLQFEQAAPPQSIRLAVWGYSAFTAGRYPKAASTISGTGLAAPTF
jgi:HK97 family phage major capsid protein